MFSPVALSFGRNLLLPPVSLKPVYSLYRELITFSLTLAKCCNMNYCPNFSFSFSLHFVNFRSVITITKLMCGLFDDYFCITILNQVIFNLSLLQKKMFTWFVYLIKLSLSVHCVKNHRLYEFNM